MAEILPSLLKLSDYIKQKLPQEWNKKGGKFGLLGFVKDADMDLTFLGSKMAVSFGSFLWLPLFAAMRVIVGKKEGKITFTTDPYAFFDEIAPVLVGILKQTIEIAKKKTPNQIGKDIPLWTNLYLTAYVHAVQHGYITPQTPRLN